MSGRLKAPRMASVTFHSACESFECEANDVYAVIKHVAVRVSFSSQLKVLHLMADKALQKSHDKHLL